MPFLTGPVKRDWFMFHISLKINPVHSDYGYKFVVNNYFYILLNLLTNIFGGFLYEYLQRYWPIFFSFRATFFF